MTQRGRGCLEIKRSRNPFFQTTSAEIGAIPDQAVSWAVNGERPPFHASTHKVDGNFSFLYSRESDRIGSKVPKSQNMEKRPMTKTEFLRMKREEAMANGQLIDNNTVDAKREVIKMNPEEYLKAYCHNSKTEDPRYTTSMVRFQVFLLSLNLLIRIF